MEAADVCKNLRRVGVRKKGIFDPSDMFVVGLLTPTVCQMLLQVNALAVPIEVGGRWNKIRHLRRSPAQFDGWAGANFQSDSPPRKIIVVGCVESRLRHCEFRDLCDIQSRDHFGD